MKGSSPRIAQRQRINSSYCTARVPRGIAVTRSFSKRRGASTQARTPPRGPWAGDAMLRSAGSPVDGDGGSSIRRGDGAVAQGRTRRNPGIVVG